MNDIPLHYLKPDSLVKFRCLIQDMFDPEFYMGVYETFDASSQAKVSSPHNFLSQPFSHIHSIFDSTLNLTWDDYQFDSLQWF